MIKKTYLSKNVAHKSYSGGRAKTIPPSVCKRTQIAR